VQVVLGGIIPDADIEEMKKQGVAAIFPPGTPLESIVDFLREHRRELG
jgi:methylmalonyl-CoA mutase C-terminal domain/subunit